MPRWVGLFTPLVFLTGMPFVPLWGVWADKYSRKAVIARSATVEAVVLAAVALCVTPWQLAASLGLIGLSLGNTGVMLAVLRETVPPARLGMVIGTLGAAGSLGFAAGAPLAALIVDGLGRSLRDVFVVSSALMFGVTAMLVMGMREVRPAVVPRGATVALAYAALRGTALDAMSRGLFILFGGALLASQMISAYMPVLVERVNGSGPGLVSAIGLVVGGSALVGAMAAPLAGALADRVGFRPMLVSALLAGAVALVVMSGAPTVAVLIAAATVFALASGAVRTTVMALLSRDVPAERRSTTLNLAYLPLYIAGIAGPALGAVLVGAGLGRVYEGAAIVLGACGVWAARWQRPSGADHGART